MTMLGRISIAQDMNISISYELELFINIFSLIGEETILISMTNAMHLKP